MLSVVIIRGFNVSKFGFIFTWSSVVQLDEKFRNVDTRFHSFQEFCSDLLAPFLDHHAKVGSKIHELLLCVIVGVVKQSFDRFEGEKVQWFWHDTGEGSAEGFVRLKETDGTYLELSFQTCQFAGESLSLYVFHVLDQRFADVSPDLEIACNVRGRHIRISAVT